MAITRAEIHCSRSLQGKRPRPRDVRVSHYVSRRQPYLNGRTICPVDMSSVSRTPLILFVSLIGITPFSVWTAGQPKSGIFVAEYNALQNTITSFSGGLRPLNAMQCLTAQQKRAHIVTHSLAQVSLIQLHNVFSESERTAHDMCLNAARKIAHSLDYIRPEDVGFLDVIVGVSTCVIHPLIVNRTNADVIGADAYQVTWMAASRILLLELSWQSQRSWNPSYIGILNKEIDGLLAAMEEMGRICPLIGKTISFA